MHKPVPFLFNDPVNEQFDKLILNDQKRTVEKVTGIPADAVIFQCSDPVMKYDSDLGVWFHKHMMESPLYTDASKIQYIKDALADTSQEEDEGDTTNKFFIANSFWRSSKEATALMHAAFDKQLQECDESDMSDESKRWTELDIRFRRMVFVSQSQLPESYQMITDYIKDRPGFNHKWYYETDLVYWLIQMGKETEALDFLEIIVEEMIRDKLFGSFAQHNYGKFYEDNLFCLLCFSENEAIAKRATDLLFHLWSKNNKYYCILRPLAVYLDKARCDRSDAFKNDTWNYIQMPEETINELIADLNSVAVKCDIPEIRLNKFSKFLISMDKPSGVISYFLNMNNVTTRFNGLKGSPEWHKDKPMDYVKLFKSVFSQLVNAHHCNHFTIGQVTTPVNENEFKYDLFVKYKESAYHLTYTEQGMHYYTDVQRLVKLLNLCLMENKEKKRFIAWHSDKMHSFVLMEPAALMPLSKKYNLRYFAIDEGDY